MIEQLTQGIKISVVTGYEGSFLKGRKVNYAFSYNITIENQGKHPVQLTSRYWEIKDSLNIPEIVQGEGVVGQQPVLLPGQQHSYTSGCILSSPHGSMRGHYNMVNLTTERKFSVPIPLFNLHAGFSLS